MKVIDMHCDTISRLYMQEGCDLAGGLRENRIHIDVKKMKAGDYLLQNFALFVDKEGVDDSFETANLMAERYHGELEKNNDLLAPVNCFADIERNHKKGKMSGMLTLEEGGILKGRIESLQHFYNLGVRMIALTWNYENELGHPNLILKKNESAGDVSKLPAVIPAFKERSKKGLKPFGLEVVKMMEAMGMIIDVSHLSDGGFDDVVKDTKAPFVASHSNAAAICNVSRNLTDDMIRTLAGRGGVMGLNFCGSFLSPQMNKEPFKNYIGTIEDMVQHIQHIRNVGGIEVCALGSDFDGIPGNPEIEDASRMQKLVEALRKARFTETEIEKIFYKNVLRVYRDVLN